MNSFIKSLIPPILLMGMKKMIGSRSGWTGNYSSWQEASGKSTGYDADLILEKVKNSLKKVKDGDAVYERDSVLFDEIQYSWPLLSGLMLAASKNAGKLSVLDFGGSLGSSYYQNKKFLDSLDEVKWGIVEQNNFTNVGKKFFQDGRLDFFEKIETCVDEINPNVLVLSSVLQYLENPYEILDLLFSCEFSVIILDRTPFSHNEEDEIKLQVVPSNIYEASYPCWFFDENKLISYFKANEYVEIERFQAVDVMAEGCKFSGSIFIRVIS